MYFETDTPVTNAFPESLNRLAKDKNREGRGYSFEVMRARMLYTTNHKKKTTKSKATSFDEVVFEYMTTVSADWFDDEINYGVDLSTI